ncbi:MAG: hypothetical protein ACJA04_000932 [Cellvibrionaceae bacterium]|jgi:uncharacterized protein YjiS (DUF1127 family)
MQLIGRGEYYCLHTHSNQILNKREILSKLSFFWRCYHTRRKLAQLTDTQLRDIGISREQAILEVRQKHGE